MSSVVCNMIIPSLGNKCHLLSSIDHEFARAEAVVTFASLFVDILLDNNNNNNNNDTRVYSLEINRPPKKSVAIRVLSLT